MARRPSAGLGIEDELSFGSDEDLLADVGEIITSTPGNPSGDADQVPPLPPISNRGPAGRVEKEKKGGMFKLGKKDEKDKDKRKRTATEETARYAAPTGTPTGNTSSAGSGKKDKSSRYLAKSALVIDPNLESVLDLTNLNAHPQQHTHPIHKLDTRDSYGSSNGSGSASLLGHGSSPNLLNGKDAVGKKKGLMGAFKAFGKSARKEDPVSIKSVQQMRSSESFRTRSDSSRQQSIDFTSSTFSSPRTDVSSLPHHHLAPISVSPFQAHAPDSSDSTIRSSNASASLSKRTSMSSFARRASVLTSTSSGTNETGDPAMLAQSVMHKLPVVPDITNTSANVDQRVTRPSLVSRSTTSSLGIPHSPLSLPFGDITSVLLPTFPATLSSLSSIQILSATVIRRVFISGSTSASNGMSMPDKERNTSIRSLTSVLSSGTNGSNSTGTRRPIWVTQQLVLTSFKVGGSTPQATPDPNEYNSERGSTSKTIAHLHLFNIPGSSAPTKSPSKPPPVGLGLGSGSSQSFGRRPSLTNGAEEMEVERQVIRGDNTASIWEGDEGKRKYVLRIGFGREQVEGDGEWVVEMRNGEQLQEWIRQIKSVAIVIRAETEGHGRAIRDAYTSGSIRGDDLALELDMQRQSASSRSPAPSTGSGLGIAAPDPRNSMISELSAMGNATGLLPIPPPRDEDGTQVQNRPDLSQRPSAARAESPNLLGSPAQESEARLSGHLSDLRLNVHRSRSLSSKVFGESPTFSPDRAPDMPLLGTPVSGQMPRAGSLHRHVKQGSWSSSTSGGSAALRKYGRAPPPPSAPPPTAPLPALPNAPGAEGPVEFTPSFQSKGDRFEPRLSLHDDSDLPLTEARQSSRASSLPALSSPDEEAKAALLKARKERLMNAFRPIPLVPELESSPKMGSRHDHDREIMSAVSSPRSVAEDIATPIVRPPTPPRQKSTSSIPQIVAPASSSDAGSVMGDGGSSGFHTPTEMSMATFPFPPTTGSTGTQGAETVESLMSTPSAHGSDTLHLPSPGSGRKPEAKRYASSVSSVPSVSSAGTGTSAGRRRRERKVAVDIMSEFNETPDAQYTPEEDGEIVEDRPRVIRFA